MKHSIEDLLSVVYAHYPRGIPSEDPRYEQSGEYRRLVAALRRAGAQKEAWRGLLRRLGERPWDEWQLVGPESGTHTVFERTLERR